MLREASLIVTGLIAFVYSLEYLFSCFDDPREPRRVVSALPFGHVLGFLRHGFDYYNITSRQTDAEIYTVGVLNFKIYVTHSMRLANVIQKSRAISSRPIIRSSNKTHSNTSNEALALFDGEVLENFSHISKEALAPGLHLDTQNLRMAEQSLLEVTDMLKQDNIELLQWATHATVQATATGLYGIQHPFKDPEIEHAMWTWDEHKPGHMLGIDPLGTGYSARTTMFKAFQKYFQEMPDDVSLVIRERQRILREAGIPEDDTYKMQSNLSDAYPNFPPTLFWTIYEIYSRPELLEAIRQELFSKAVRKSDNISILDISSLQTECHILLSAFQETQRVRHSQVAFRIVVEDVLLDNKYLLKKGSYVHQPAKAVHKNHEIWGPQASEFDPYRFVQAEAGKTTKTKILPSGFRAWGSPPHMCPARQFAATEVLIFTALLALRVDLTPMNGEGWEKEPALKSMEIAMLPRPKKDVHLKVTAREEEGAGRWAIETGRIKTRVPLASG